MSERIVELDQIDEREFDLGQEDEQQFDLGNPETVIITGTKVQDDPVDGGVAIYNEQDDELKTILPDSEVTEDSDNLVTSGAVYDYVQNNGGKIDSISVNGVEQEIDQNKNVDITVPTSTSDLTNDGDGESPFATQAYVEENGGKIDSISVNGTEQTIDENKNVDITIPTDVSDLNNDLNFQTDTDVESAISTATSGMLTTTNYATTLDNVYQAKGSYATTSDLSAVSGRVSTIESEIPEQASSSNQLADKNFVNSSISTATATFRGTYNLVSDLSLTTSATEGQIATALLTAVSTADNNDYCFVQIPTADATPTEISRIDRYKFNGTAWAYEYSLNNSGFTASQWAAINSGATTTNIGQISTNTSNISSLNSNKVDKTTTIAGVDLQDNITKSELLTALNVADGAQVNAIESISTVDGTLTIDANKNVTIPKAGSSRYGLIKVTGGGYGMAITNAGEIYIVNASDSIISSKTDNYKPITASKLDYAVKVGVTTNTVALTDSEKASAQSWLGITPRGIARLV